MQSAYPHIAPFSFPFAMYALLRPMLKYGNRVFINGTTSHGFPQYNLHVPGQRLYIIPATLNLFTSERYWATLIEPIRVHQYYKINFITNLVLYIIFKIFKVTVLFVAQFRLQLQM